MSVDRFAVRRQRLLSQLKQQGIDTLLVHDETNVSYLTGFSGDSSWLLVGRDRVLLISDTRYTEQIQEECPGLETIIRDSRVKMNEALMRTVKKSGLKQLGFESDSMSVAQWQELTERLQPTKLVPTMGVVEGLRMIKDGVEVGEIRKAVRQAERGFALLRELLTGEMTERQAAHELEHAMRRFGAEKAGFAPIVAAGARWALPHARPGVGRVFSAEMLLVDWGARTVSGYHSDLTRVMATGNISPKLKKVYKVVLNAQRKGLEAIRPGIRACDVDRAARRVIERAGFGKCFGHGLGHGIGLKIHEEPRLSPISQTELRPGMVVTVEPGVYIPGWGGVRIEDDVLVTRDGCEILTSVPKQLENVCLR